MAGTITELEDHLTAAEANHMNGPSHDLQLFRLFLKENNVPQQLALLCLNAKEMRLQSHLDCTPLVVIRYQLSHQMLTIIRSIMQSERCLQKLTKTYVHVALMGSSFDTEACSKLFFNTNNAGDNSHFEVGIFQPTMSTQRMVVGNILTGNERDFSYDLEEAVDQACQAGNALNTQRCLLEENRQLKKRQEAELRLSEAADKAKTANNGMNETVVDTAEVRKRRIDVLDERGLNKRPRNSSSSQGDESGIVVLNPQTSSLPCHTS
ncbi:uncharacterized protein LOC144640332 isoform X2 [Oculina patagonica]